MLASRLSLTVLSATAVAAGVLQHSLRQAPDFDWNDITPTQSLTFTDCFDGKQCARLEVPLDWNATKEANNQTVAVAIVKLPARVPVTDARYGGPILLNQGGPGGSGTQFALDQGQSLQTTFDAAYSYGSNEYLSDNKDARYFDIIGFDPRGIAATTPFFTCSTDRNEQARRAAMITSTQAGVPEFSTDYFYSMVQAAAANCVYSRQNGSEGLVIAEFMTSTMVARDMVEIVERHGEWREAQATRLRASPETMQNVSWKRNEEPVLYYGLSYGTVLGATLAAMQPHRVKRFHLDGVVEAASYYEGNLVSGSDQGDEQFELFFRECAEAGPDLCAMWAGNSSDDTRKRYEAILDDFAKNGPLVVNLENEAIPVVLTTQDVLQTVLPLTNSPLLQARGIADMLAPLSKRNGTLIAQSKLNSDKGAEEGDQDDSKIDPSDPSGSNFAGGEILANAISGSEMRLRLNQTGFAQILEQAQNVSKYAGSSVVSGDAGTFVWPGRGKWNFGADHQIASNVTANPILWSSNLVDAVTSLGSARAMQAKFKDSGLLIVDGEGHTASTSTPSLCAGKAYREYFQTGRLPDTSRMCLPIIRPFLGDKAPNVERDQPRNKEEEVLQQAVRRLVGV